MSIDLTAALAPDDQELDGPVASSRGNSVVIAAICTWVVLLPLAFFGPNLIGLDPLSLRGTELPLAVGGVLVAVFGALALWRPALAASTGVAAFAAWLLFTLRTALLGTPFGFNGLTDDMPRLTAMATRFSVTAWNSDGIVAGVPTEYPPLFPWVVGRVSALTGVPAWRLLPKAEVVLISLAVLAAFLLWHRLTSSTPIAVAITVVGFTVFHNPAKAYEVFCIGVTVAWVLLTAGRPPEGRLHWAVSGVIGGLLLLTYQGYLMYSAAGTIALAVLTWRAEPDRRGYLRYLVKVLATSAVVASPFLVSFGVQKIVGGSQYVADLFQTSAITGDLTPFLSFSLLGVLQLLGLVGMVWRRNVSWWALPVLALTVGTYVYRAGYAVVYVLTAHTGMIHHAAVMTDYLLAAAGVLTLSEVALEIITRFRLAPPRGVGVVALVSVIVWSGAICWADWMPNTGNNATKTSDSSTLSAGPLLAFTEPRADGHRARNLKVFRTPWFPAGPVRTFVEARLGKGVLPRTLAYDERLFSFLPWKGYTTVDRTATLSTVRWDDRYAALSRLAKVSDPRAFAQASARTEFGAIDVFVLQKRTAGWVWAPEHAGRPVVFQPSQFDPAVFDVADDLPLHTIVAVRRA